MDLEYDGISFPTSHCFCFGAAFVNPLPTDEQKNCHGPKPILLNTVSHCEDVLLLGWVLTVV